MMILRYKIKLKFIFSFVFFFLYFFYILHAEAALNLFINTNAQELLKEMKPDLRTKLTQIMEQFMNRLFEKIPLEQWHD